MSEPSTETIEVTQADRESPVGERGDAPKADVLVERELLVEDVSIDGMCGVY